MDDIDDDPELRLLQKEPELWVHTVDKSVSVDCKTYRKNKIKKIYIKTILNT